MFGSDGAGAARSEPWSLYEWMKKSHFGSRPYSNGTCSAISGILLGVGAGGLVGTGFVLKKIGRVCGEAVALAKQIKKDPENKALRKKRRILIGKAVGMGIGGFVLMLFSALSLGIGGAGFNALHESYNNDYKFALDLASSSEKKNQCKSSAIAKIKLHGGGLRKPKKGDWIAGLTPGAVLYDFNPRLQRFEFGGQDDSGGAVRFCYAGESPFICDPLHGEDLGDLTWADFGFLPPSQK